jgi:hypothetical protein
MHMGKGRDKQGREAKKKKKVNGAAAPAADMQFRHHAVVTSQPEAQPKAAE